MHSSSSNFGRCRLAMSWARFIFAICFFAPHASAQTPHHQVQPHAPFRVVYSRQSRLPIFVMDAPTHENIFALSTNGGPELQLTYDNHSLFPLLSPDGSQIAFIHIKPETCEGCLLRAQYELYVMNADGTEPHFITDLETPLPIIQWSPDGERISYGGWPRRDPQSFNLSSSTLYVVDARSDASPLALAQDAAGFSAWSPDGMWIAYQCLPQQSTSTAQARLCVTDTQGHGLSRVVAEEQPSADFSWSPDGSRILFGERNKKAKAIYTAGINASPPLLLTTANLILAHPQWSPDSKQILFSDIDHGKEGIYVINADGSDRRRLTDPKMQATNPLWSPDGKQIAFTALVHRWTQVHLMNADGSGLVQVTHEKKKGCSVRAWMPNSSLLLLSCGYLKFLHGDRVPMDLDLSVLDLSDSAGVPRLLQKGFHSSVSFASNSCPAGDYRCVANAILPDEGFFPSSSAPKAR